MDGTFQLTESARLDRWIDYEKVSGFECVYPPRSRGTFWYQV